MQVPVMKSNFNISNYWHWCLILSHSLDKKGGGKACFRQTLRMTTTFLVLALAGANGRLHPDYVIEIQCGKINIIVDIPHS